MSHLDLEHNQRGELSAEQREALSKLKPPRAPLPGRTPDLIRAALWSGLAILATEFYVRADGGATWFLPLLGVAVFTYPIRVWCGRWLERRRWTHRLRQDVQGGRVLTGEGSAAWGEGKYTPLLEGRVREAAPWLTLAPGTYRFYYLPRSRLVISRERLGEQGEREYTEISQAFATASGLPKGALAENRLGRLTPAQKDWLLQKRLLSFGGGLLLPLLAAAWFYRITTDLAAGKRDDALWLLPFALIALVLAAPCLYRAGRMYLDIRGGAVQTLEDRLELVSLGNRWGYRFGGLWLRAPAQLQSALISGLRYRAYLAPRSKMLLNLEPVGKDEAAPSAPQAEEELEPRRAEETKGRGEEP
jgi:hypothetical protein